MVTKIVLNICQDNLSMLLYEKLYAGKHLRESESSVLTPVHLPIKSSESSRQSSSTLKHLIYIA